MLRTTRKSVSPPSLLTSYSAKNGLFRAPPEPALTVCDRGLWEFDCWDGFCSGLPCVSPFPFPMWLPTRSDPATTVADRCKFRCCALISRCNLNSSNSSSSSTKSSGLRLIVVGCLLIILDYKRNIQSLAKPGTSHSFDLFYTIISLSSYLVNLQ